MLFQGLNRVIDIFANKSKIKWQNTQFILQSQLTSCTFSLLCTIILLLNFIAKCIFYYFLSGLYAKFHITRTCYFPVGKQNIQPPIRLHSWTKCSSDAGPHWVRNLCGRQDPRVMIEVSKMIYCALLSICRSDAASRLKLLHSTGWLGRQMVALKVQFTLYSPAPNLFTSVTLLAERSTTGVLRPSAKVQSAKVFHSPDTQDYPVMVYQVRFI